MKIIYTFVLLAVVSFSGVSQNWAEMMQQPNGNFYDVQNAFNEYWQDKDHTEKGKGYKAFKRWENFAERRVYPSGDLSLLGLTGKNFQEWLENNREHIHYDGNSTKLTSNNMIASTTWTAIGPMGPISGTGNGQFLKSGRLNFITISPTNTNVLWVGAPAGGLWKSVDGGNTWTTNTDNLSVNGCSDLAIDPTNPNIMYLATGDGDAGDTRSIGVLKSTDGGNTWNPTGLSAAVTANFLIRRLIIHPTNPLILLAATNSGIRRTTDGGVTWTTPNTANAYDLEWHPGNPNIVYCGGTTFRRSTDGGVTWTTINSGITTTGVNRMAVAVTPANSSAVYVLASASSNSGFYAFYRSTDAGVTFSAMATSTPNLLGWASAGNDSGGQGWYDLCVAASPTNSNEVVVGGVNVWRTTNGGSSWSLYGHWTGSGAPFTHADHHDLEYAPNGTLFNCNDGTVYRRTATAWQEISGTMNISQIYKVGTSALTANLWISGHQDNGTSTWNGTTYQARLGGDGMDCFIDRTNNNNMFAEYYNGAFRRTTNAGSTWSTVTTGLSGTAPWVTIWKQDPQNATRIWCGRQNMFVSNNLATSWTQAGTLPVTGSVNEFAIAPSNNQIIYVVKNGAVMKTIDGGASWTNVTGTLSTGLAFANVCVSPTDPNKVWVVSGNYTNGSKVFYSSNGGTSWTNMTANLPNIPANCLLYEPGSNDRIYVGMDVGVYYRDANQSTWTLYNIGLPNTPISDMEITTAMPGKIVAATYGRGMWVVDVVPTAAAPVSSFNLTGPVCTGVPKVFNNTSTNGPTSYTWAVSPSAGVTINTPSAASPSITFANTGNYVVSMTTSNSIGPGNTFTQSITVFQTPVVIIASSANTVCAGSPVTFTASGASTYAWACPTTSVCTYFPSTTTNYSFIGTSAQGCTAAGTKSIVVSPSVNVNVSSSSAVACSNQTVSLSATGASSYTWNPGNLNGNSIVVSPSSNTTYSVTGSNGNCSNTKTIAISAGTTPTVSAATTTSLLCAGTAATLSASGATSYSWSTGATTSTLAVFPTLSTTYTVIGFNGPCSSTTTIVQNVAWCTGISEALLSDGTFVVYPNPFSSELNFTSGEEVEMQMMNALGQVIRSAKFNGIHTVETAELPTGVYMIYLKANSGTKSLKVIKN
jgi:hypothetical protein